jgi:hypothetical protein
MGWKILVPLRTTKVCSPNWDLANYSGRGKFMPLLLKSKILETFGSLVTVDIKMFPL